MITFSLRGHGGCAGRSTAGGHESHDPTAAVRRARSPGHRRTATVDPSPGGSVARRQAAPHGRRRGADGRGEHGERTDAFPDVVVAVSAPPGGAPPGGTAGARRRYPASVTASANWAAYRRA
ncbi:hypothetical protein [Streptomyces noursei]|uniref:hypothetical protein n=1 Tax=Streptomyces noursei TaxID=1971 RepID=UPI00167B25CD|nr:hypothetical protein [Streptomyces noursei]GGX18716.1 hypothetical protein GCM10010341_45090 [Streptomyces noursei]